MIKSKLSGRGVGKGGNWGLKKRQDHSPGNCPTVPCPIGGKKVTRRPKNREIKWNFFRIFFQVKVTKVTKVVSISFHSNADALKELVTRKIVLKIWGFLREKSCHIVIDLFFKDLKIEVL